MDSFGNLPVLPDEVINVHRTAFFAGAVALVLAFPAGAALPPVPEPAENPVTEAKRVLGKMLFWEEQLSSDNTVACGTCHRPGAGGADSRSGTHPGRDGLSGTDDDIAGSPGIRTLDTRGRPVSDPDYGHAARVTDRSSPPYFMSLWAESVFWDGRARSEFRDPLSGQIVIAKGGALENQSLGPLLNSNEMAQPGRSWSDVTEKLQQAVPLALARNLPADLSGVLEQSPDYPTLFARAFGDPGITPVRIAMAIASYERTLVADQTPWDLAGRVAATKPPEWQTGVTWFEHHQCNVCHVPPLFTNNDFVNAGVREAHFDRGHATVTGLDDDAGDMKVPSLRNLALRQSYMHTGMFKTLDEVLDLYANPQAPADPLPTTGEPYVVRMTEPAREALKRFLLVGLLDPRVAAETYPFDRPLLRSEQHPDNLNPPSQVASFKATRTAGGTLLQWTAATDDIGVADYVVTHNGTVVALPTHTAYTDMSASAAVIHRYGLVARDSAGNASTAGTVIIWPAWFPYIGMLLVLVAGLALRILQRLRGRIPAGEKPS